MRYMLSFILILTLVGIACSSSAAPAQISDSPSTTETEIVPPTSPPENNEAASVSETMDTCEIFTKEDVKIFLGKNIEPSEFTVQGYWAGAALSSCAYQYVGEFGQAVLVLGQFDSSDSASVFFTETQQSMEDLTGIKPENVTSVGDEAFWIGDAVVNEFHLRQGNIYLKFTITGQDGPDEAYLNFINQVLARLP